MKKLILVMMTLNVFGFLSACGNNRSENSSKIAGDKIQSSADESKAESKGKSLVVWFSYSGNTTAVANEISEITGADRWQLNAAQPYTAADVDYNNDSSRSSVENNNASARPAIKGRINNWDQYDVIYLGYPIWWGIAPKIIYTFLESYDFSGKTIIPFCTSASSGLGTSDSVLYGLCSDKAIWKPGHRFAGSASKEAVKKWIDSLSKK